mmetsp:Transcript_32744/g.48490  ORF Transcript_32744/g.48490 Transcript_32744/m.48490 type:complete len:203 (+) Transcript_32744:342-950(+)
MGGIVDHHLQWRCSRTLHLSFPDFFEKVIVTSISTVQSFIPYKVLVPAMIDCKISPRPLSFGPRPLLDTGNFHAVELGCLVVSNILRVSFKTISFVISNFQKLHREVSSAVGPQPAIVNGIIKMPPNLASIVLVPGVKTVFVVFETQRKFTVTIRLISLGFVTEVSETFLWRRRRGGGRPLIGILQCFCNCCIDQRFHFRRG